MLLNKKEENRIYNVLKGSPLKFFDKNMKVSDSFADVINNIESCSSNTYKLLEIMTSSGAYKKESLLNKVNSDSLVLISKLCESCSADNKAINNITIRTVFGAVEHMPLRALTYLLPAIKMAESIVEYQKSLGKKEIYLPQIEFVIMLKIGSVLNELDYCKCSKEVNAFINIATSYLNAFHFGVSSCVKFLVDQEFSTNLRKNNEYCNYELKVKNLLGTNDVGTILKEMGNRRNHSNSSYEYAAMHPLLHDVLIDRNIASFTEYGKNKNPESKDTLALISIGARPEEEFWKMRQLVKSILKELTFITPVPAIQYIARMNVPPYSPLNTGELYLDDVINDPKTILLARFQEYKKTTNYQIPVQKSVELLIKDADQSADADTLVKFMQQLVI